MPPATTPPCSPAPVADDLRTNRPLDERTAPLGAAMLTLGWLAMPNPETALDRARRHVAQARRYVARQEAQIAERERDGRSASRSRVLLTTMKDTLRLFEEQLACLKQEAQQADRE